jgi:predicted outer membrane repeat protein
MKKPFRMQFRQIFWRTVFSTVTVILVYLLLFPSLGTAEPEGNGENPNLLREQILHNPELFITVGKEGCDFRLIQEAVHQAVPERNVIVLMDPVYTEAGIIIDRDVKIRGFGAEHTILQAGQSPEIAQDRVLVIREGMTAVVTAVTIRHGNPTKPHRCGAGIQNFGDLTLEGCDIRNNTAVYGVGIWNKGRLVMRNCNVSDNRSLRRTTAEIKDATGCTGAGAGIKNEPDAELVCYNSTISGNSAGNKGGGLFVSCESKAKMVNCTVSGNESKRSGGGIHTRGDLELVHCTIANNRSTRQGGGICNLGHLDVVACLIAGNQVLDFVMGFGAGIYGKGQIGINDYNLIADGSFVSYLTGDPRLAPLADNGGGTLTHALQQESPAVKVIPPEVLATEEDQRGLPRGAGSDDRGKYGDIGAFEWQ